MTPSPASPALDAKGLSKERIELDVEASARLAIFAKTLETREWTSALGQAYSEHKQNYDDAKTAFIADLTRALSTRHDVGYLMAVIDAAIEDGFDPDEDGPLLDEIRAELASGRTPPGPLDTPASSVVPTGVSAEMARNELARRQDAGVDARVPLLGPTWANGLSDAALLAALTKGEPT